MVVTVMHLTLKGLLALLGRTENPKFKNDAAAEVKRMMTAYVDDVIKEKS